MFCCVRASGFWSIGTGIGAASPVGERSSCATSSASILDMASALATSKDRVSILSGYHETGEFTMATGFPCRFRRSRRSEPCIRVREELYVGYAKIHFRDCFSDLRCHPATTDLHCGCKPEGEIFENGGGTGVVGLHCRNESPRSSCRQRWLSRCLYQKVLVHTSRECSEYPAPVCSNDKVMAITTSTCIPYLVTVFQSLLCWHGQLITYLCPHPFFTVVFQLHPISMSVYSWVRQLDCK